MKHTKTAESMGWFCCVYLLKYIVYGIRRCLLNGKPPNQVRKRNEFLTLSLVVKVEDAAVHEMNHRQHNNKTIEFYKNTISGVKFPWNGLRESILVYTRSLEHFFIH